MALPPPDALLRKIPQPRVRAAFSRVDRALFVPPALQGSAWEDGPLPIGEEQTISQPSLVAHMTALLEVQPHHRVLELGTGSGYQAALLSLLAAAVFSVEVRPALAQRARERLQALGYVNVRVRCADGALGWPEEAPFDRILITAACPSIPAGLLPQLKSGGLLLLPLGPWHDVQELTLAENRDGELHLTGHGAVRFVPFV